jgi:hypothetical protein
MRSRRVSCASARVAPGWGKMPDEYIIDSSRKSEKRSLPRS